MNQHIHGGDIYRNRITSDFSVNLNPLGLPEEVETCLRESIKDWGRYPDPECKRLTERLAELHQTEASGVFCGNGAAELIYLLVQAKKPKKALIPAPAFFEYERALHSVGCQVEYYYLKEEKGFVPDMEELSLRVGMDTDMVFFCNPNNPTGIPVEREGIRKLAKACHQNHAFLVVDECFCEFLDAPVQSTVVPLTVEYPRLAVLRAFTKTFAMAGLRLGYGICHEEGLWERVRAIRQPWSVSVPAQEAGMAALESKICGPYLERTRALLQEQRPELKEGLKELGFTVYDSQANYLFFKAPWETGKEDEESLYEQCKKHEILIRDCSNFAGLSGGYYRICIRGREENLHLLERLGQIVDKGDGQR